MKFSGTQRGSPCCLRPGAGKVSSPGTEGPGAASTQICLSSTDAGLRVYTMNSATLSTEREEHIQCRAQPCLLNTVQVFYTDPLKHGFKGGFEGNHVIL